MHNAQHCNSASPVLPAGLPHVTVGRPTRRQVWKVILVFLGFPRRGHHARHSLAPAQVVRRLLVFGRTVVTFVNLHKQELCRILDATQNIETNIVGLPQRSHSIFHRSLDESLLATRGDIDEDVRDVKIIRDRSLEDECGGLEAGGVLREDGVPLRRRPWRCHLVSHSVTPSRIVCAGLVVHRPVGPPVDLHQSEAAGFVDGLQHIEAFVPRLPNRLARILKRGSKEGLLVSWGDLHIDDRNKGGPLAHMPGHHRATPTWCGLAGPGQHRRPRHARVNRNEGRSTARLHDEADANEGPGSGNDRCCY
mmetsp:Transcript_99066/g.212223  ORF Transcript_99066/g.212223 Transcript_99066/m.212223 type:complete len:307 (-) Transcript_99066:129-1049(-)